jgi:hypothetical protein
MFRAVALTVGMVGMVATWCSSAMPAVAILGGCGVASTFGLGVGRVAKGRTGMGLGGKSF